MFLDITNDVAFVLSYFLYAIPLWEPQLEVYDM